MRKASCALLCYVLCCVVSLFLSVCLFVCVGGRHWSHGALFVINVVNDDERAQGQNGAD